MYEKSNFLDELDLESSVEYCIMVGKEVYPVYRQRYNEEWAKEVFNLKWKRSFIFKKNKPLPYDFDDLRDMTAYYGKPVHARDTLIYVGQAWNNITGPRTWQGGRGFYPSHVTNNASRAIGNIKSFDLMVIRRAILDQANVSKMVNIEYWLDKLPEGLREDVIFNMHLFV